MIPLPKILWGDLTCDFAWVELIRIRPNHRLRLQATNTSVP
jgi:hypothetical protein